MLLPSTFDVVRITARFFIGAYIDGLIIQRQMVGEGIVIILMVAAGIIFVQKNL